METMHFLSTTKTKICLNSYMKMYIYGHEKAFKTENKLQMN